ncbi:hypothetical protein ACOSQ2_031605 [Xanthoceras sorbifolium]
MSSHERSIRESESSISDRGMVEQSSNSWGKLTAEKALVTVVNACQEFELTISGLEGIHCIPNGRVVGLAKLGLEGIHCIPNGRVVGLAKLALVGVDISRIS